MTNNEFFERIYKPYQEQHVSKSTCYTRCNIIGNRLLDEHGEEEPGDISYLVIEGIYDDMETAGLMQNTIFGTYAALLSFFKMATEYGETDENPVRFARTVCADIQSYDHTRSQKRQNRREKHDEH